ncbi:MAG: FHIPEP family type III secretion protein [bacterium]|nr:FHIPEP family type III secretion protein [bacterium]
MRSTRPKFVIKSAPSDDAQALEDLLNGMSKDGWDLYSMHEVETEDGYQFNCIFASEEEVSSDNDDDILDSVTFKSQMEKLLSSKTSAYESCVEIQQKIKEKRAKIAALKSKLEAQLEAPISKSRKVINDEISDAIKELDGLKQELVQTISPNSWYSKVNEDKLVISMSEEVLPVVNPDLGAPLIAETVKVRENLTMSLGYVLSKVKFDTDDELNSNEFSIKIHGNTVLTSAVYSGYKAFYESDLNVSKKIKDAIYDTDVTSGRKVVWIKEDKTKDYWENGYTAAEFIAKNLEWVAVNNVDDLLDYDDVNKYMEIVGEKNSFLVENIIPDFVSVSEIKYILACLIRERVSIKDIVYVFEKINDYADDSMKEDLLDKIRLALAKNICKSNADENGVIPAVDLSEKSYTAIFSSLEESDDNVVRIEATKASKVVKKYIKILKEAQMLPSDVVVLAPMEVRHMLFMVFANFMPNVKVMAKEEIESEFTLEMLGEI